MLGISIYLGSEPIAKQIPYIRKMREMGFHSIFTSLHIPEENQTIYKEQLQALGEIATELEMELMADISPHSLEALGVNWETADILLNWGLTGLRIDYGIDEQTIIDLSHKMRIALNASTITKDELNRMKEMGLNISAVEAWHNYYPRPETGLGFRDFNRRNEELKEAGLTTMAFIPGDEKLRGPLFEKLPTLERHRAYSPFAAFLDLEKRGNVDKIMIGDVTIRDASCEQFRAYDQGEIVVHAIASEGVDKGLLEQAAAPFTNRADPARDVVRAVESRSYAQYGDTVVKPQHTIERPIGSITMDNERYMRYQGEIQITLTNLPADERVNVLGKVIEEDIPILRWIKGNQNFRIVWV